MDSQPQLNTYELASFGIRFVAFVIDYIVLGLVSFGVMLFIGPLISTMLELMVLDIVLTAAYNWYFWTRREGQTPGKRIMNIRVIKVDGTPMSDTDALLRIFGYYVGRMTLFLGYLWAVFDAQNQAVHDKIGKTFVVVAPPENKTVTI